LGTQSHFREEQMMKRIANMLLVMTCLAAVIVMAPRWMPTFKNHFRPQPTDYKVGQVANKLTNLPPSQKTLVMGVWTHCSVCQHDVPIYQRLAQAKHVVDGQIKVVALFPPPNMTNSEKSPTTSNSTADEQEFIKRTAMPASVFIPEEFPFTSTPTLLLLDKDKKIIWTWKGGLTTNEEKTLFELLS
jgi:hypothetical protein